MFERLRTLFDGKPRRGDLVTVLNGPYAGKSGTIIGVDGDESTVYIDECCQPKLAHSAFNREWRGRGIPGAFKRRRAQDPEGEIARMLLGQQDRIDPLI